MLVSEFKKVGRILKEAYAETEREAILAGVDLGSEEYQKVIDLVREKVLAKLGYTLEEYRIAKENTVTAKNVSVDDTSRRRVEKLLDTHIASTEEIKAIAEEVAKKEVKAPIIENRVIKEVIREKPITTIIERKTEYDDTYVTGQIEDLREQVAKAKKVDPEKIKDDLKGFFGKTLKKNIDTLGMPDFRKLAMGLQGQIDELRTAEGSDVDSVSGTTNRITSTGGKNPVIDISASYVGQTSITTLGTITTGVWNGTAIANANLANSSLTIGSTNIALGATSTTLAGLTSVTSTIFVGALTGNATTATALATGRTISITGDLTYTSPSFDGSANVTAAGTLASIIVAGGPTGSATVAPIITYDAKGRLTAVSSATITPAVGSITGLGTGVATALAVNVGTAGAFVVNGGVLGTPSSGTVTNLTGTASININGTVGATTPAAGTFTSVTDSGLTSGRVTYAGASGLLKDSANMTFDGNTLTVSGSGTNSVIFRNNDATGGYGAAFESEGTGATRYALILRNLAQTVIYGGVSTATGQVGYWGIGADPVGTLANRLTVGGAVSIGSGVTSTTAPSNGLLVQGDTALNSNLAVTGNITVSRGASGVGLTLGNASFYSSVLMTNSYIRADATNGVLINSNTDALNLFQFKNDGTSRWFQYGAGALTTDGSGNITAVSDERVKKDIRPFDRGLADILKINPILHGYTKESGLDQTKNDYAGFSAQNILETIPESVGKDARGYLTLADRGIIAALVNAVKELKEENENLSMKIKNL